MTKKVRLYHEKLIIPNYPLGKDDVLPPLIAAMCPRAKGVYPYPLSELTGSGCEEKEFDTLVLENDYLKLQFLPELGGRLISAFDKQRNREIFFRNQVLKPVMAGLTAAWCGIGVEFNFPGSHSVTSNRPVHCSGKIDSNGAGIVTIADQELVSEMKWRVQIKLFPDSDIIKQESLFCNRTALPHHGYFWTNAKTPAYSDTEFVFPSIMEGGIIHPPMDITRITRLKLPMVNQVDISKYSDVYFQLPLFFRNMRSSEFGIYHREKDEGVLHCADCGTLPGRKIWTLGTGDDGMVINENLTEDNSPNIEMQSGPLPVQTDFFFLNPGASHRWSEYWIPVHSMGRYLTGNQYFTVSESGSILKIQCHKTMGKLSCKSKGKGGWRKIDLTPEVGEIITLEAGNELKIMDSVGFVFLSYSPEKIEETQSESITPNSSEAWYIRGRYAQELNERNQSDQFFRKALKDDSTFTPAITALAVNCLARGDYGSARDYLERALYKNRRLAEVSYYLGYTYLKLGDYTNGCFHLQRARFDSGWRCPASVELAKAYLQQRRFFELETLFCEELYDENKKLIVRCELEPLLEICAVYRRICGRDNQELLAAIKTVAPENIILRAEEFLLENSDISREDPRYLQLAFRFYDEINCLNDARKIAAAYSGDDPILDYLTGNVSAAELHPLDGIFPFSCHLADILGKISAKNPTAKKIHYYMGCIHASLADWKRAMAEWRLAAKLGLKEPALFRNMGLTEWKIFERPQSAVEYYTHGFQAGEVSYKYIYEFDTLLDECGLISQRLELVAKLPLTLRNNPYVILRQAKLKYDIGEFAAAIKILESGKFVLSEGKRMTSSIFIESNLKLGMDKLKSGDYMTALAYFEKALSYPHNLGVGRSEGCFDMRIKYHILLALKSMDESTAFKTRKREFIREYEELAIAFDSLNTLRWESGEASSDQLILENAEYLRKIKKMEENKIMD